MKQDLILNGIDVGRRFFEDPGFSPEKFVDHIKENCIEKGFNFVSLGFRNIPFDQEYFVEWAKFLADNQIFFCFMGITIAIPNGKECMVRSDIIARIKEAGGEYFLGEMRPEPGSAYACKLPGYYMEAAKDFSPEVRQSMVVDPTQYRSIARAYHLERHNDMEQAHAGYIKNLSRFIDINKRYGMPETLSVDATAFAKYNAEAGVTIPLLEVLPTSAENMVSNIRGTAKALDSKMWGTFMAHEFYGGMRHTDMLKKKRLELAYKYSYMSGSQIFQLEGGQISIKSFGANLDADSDVCRNYRRVLKEMGEYMRQDVRPAGGPKVKVAFVSGLHDGWSGKWGRSCLWNQFYREEWGYSDAEHSWGLLDELQTKRSWTDVDNYGDHDTSGAPAYGLYDIVPIEAPAEKLFAYDYLIFLGWNTMTEENMDKLIAYVRQGGHLVMSAAHLNTQTKRDGAFEMVSDWKIEELFGCRYMGEIRRTVCGANFKYDSLDERVLYPVYHTGGCDPLYAAGYADYARFAVVDGKTIAYASDSYAEKLTDLPMVIENKIGSGVATLVTHTCYPGNPRVSRLYRAVVREMLSASARNCEVQVVCSDRVRYAVYEGGKMYLLNTDFDLPTTVKIVYNGNEQTVTLDALELKSIQL